MPIKFRQKKKEQPQQQHPQYEPNTGTHWADQYREDNKSSFRRTFIAVIAILVVIMIILIVATINAVMPEESNVRNINAADTFAVSQVEQQQMEQASTTFAEGVLVYAYCADEQTALQGKTAAMQQMANNTDAYAKIEALEPVARIIDPENFSPVVTTPLMKGATRAYSGEFTYEFDAVAADTSVTSEANPNGTFADAGYHFEVVFSYYTNEDDENTDNGKWVISQVTITEN